MTITDRILNQLAAGEVRTLSQLLAESPELAVNPHGADVLCLLLRLDRRLRLLSDGRWTLTTAQHTPEQRIVVSAQRYLDQLPGSGALLDSVVTHVVDETNYDRGTVRSVILSRFVNRGKLVRNQLKETP
jgi:hypothetical protein